MFIGLALLFTAFTFNQFTLIKLLLLFDYFHKIYKNDPLVNTFTLESDPPKPIMFMISPHKMANQPYVINDQPLGPTEDNRR